MYRNHVGHCKSLVSLLSDSLAAGAYMGAMKQDGGSVGWDDCVPVPVKSRGTQRN
jgi:hypothetical protein